MPVPLPRRMVLARQHGGHETIHALAHAVSEVTGSPINESEIEALESGAQKLSRRLIDIAAACRVRPAWLMLGEEPMVPGGEPSEISPDDFPISAAERELILRWRQLDVRVVRPAIKALIEEYAALTHGGLLAWEEARAADKRRRD